jgi:hypothetical protein
VARQEGGFGTRFVGGFVVLRSGQVLFGLLQIVEGDARLRGAVAGGGIAALVQGDFAIEMRSKGAQVAEKKLAIQ